MSKRSLFVICILFFAALAFSASQVDAGTYTIDGNPPTETSTRYTAPVAINATTTLKAGAFKTGWTPSDIATGTFIIENGDKTTLYLRDHNLLSDKKGDPVPWNFVSESAVGDRHRRLDSAGLP
jgi:hypothetical protein